MAAVKVTRISPDGVTLLTDGRELFLSYDDFPWFKGAPVEQVMNVEQPSSEHFYWPELEEADILVCLGFDANREPRVVRL